MMIPKAEDLPAQNPGSERPAESDDGSEGSSWEESCIAIARGVTVPSREFLDDSLLSTRPYVIHGLRTNLDYALSEAMVALCKDPKYPDFTRARNARLIMSNIIPKDMQPGHRPYCIWFPDLASESTYKELASVDPQMRYQVGRACAVAGYTALYTSLDLLPDVSTAEEARENGDLGSSIYAEIMRHPFRFNILDDATLTVNDVKPCIGFLNANTAVQVSLARKDCWRNCRFDFDITEDRQANSLLQGAREEKECIKFSDDDTRLLCNPLPVDLPTMNKELLILMAAYEGNIDRYARLRYPRMIIFEKACVLRGIIHSAMFAKWYSTQCSDNDKETKQALYARRIMSNDLSWLSDDIPKAHLPYMIWHPQVPETATLEELVRRRPDMNQSVAHACIVLQCAELLDRIPYRPTQELFWEAEQKKDTRFMEAIRKRAEKLGVELERTSLPDVVVGPDKEPTTNFLPGFIGPSQMELWLSNGGLQWELTDSRFLQEVNSGQIDLYILSPDELRKRAREVGRLGLYYDFDDDKDVNIFS